MDIKTRAISIAVGLLAATQIWASQPQTSDHLNRANIKTATGLSILASEQGALLDSSLLLGGGTDDTRTLQAILDRAEDGTPVHLVIDGAALVEGLNVYGNTIIECINGGGLYLRDRSNRSIIRNVHRSRDSIRDERITVQGCFLNGNRWNQSSTPLPGTNIPSNKEPDGTFLTGLQFLGVNDLKINNVTLWNIRAFGALIGNANRVDIRNVTIDYGASPNDSRNYSNTDGLHFKGPLRYVNIYGVRVRTADDAIAFNANDYEIDDLTARNDFGPYVRQGPIRDVTVNNVHFMDTIWGIRFLSSSERIDRVIVSNVTGTVKGGYVVNISHFINPKSLGNVGSISISNVDVDRSAPSEGLVEQIKGWVKDPEAAKELNSGEIPFISLNSYIECLSLQNITTKGNDTRPVLRFGPDAKVKMIEADLRVYDPELKIIPVELQNGGHIDNLNLSLFWNSLLLDQGKQPIAYLGGSIGRLNWINTPPMYVSAHSNGKNIVTVSFTQNIKASDFQRGVTIKVNDTPVQISKALLQRGANAVQYELKDPIRRLDTVKWSYNAADGTIQNWSGNQLLTVSEKRAAASP